MFHTQNYTTISLQAFHTVLQTLQRLKQPKSNVIDSKEMISATVQAAFIYTQILSLTRGTEIIFL